MTGHPRVFPVSKPRNTGLAPHGDCRSEGRAADFPLLDQAWWVLVSSDTRRFCGGGYFGFGASARDAGACSYPALIRASLSNACRSLFPIS